MSTDEQKDAPDTFSIQELVDASPAIISLIDTQKWQVRFQNCSSRAMFGEVVGGQCHEKFVQSAGPCTFCRATEALETGKTTSSEVTLPDGRWILIQWAPIRSGQTFLAVESIIDVTESKRREEEARRLKDLFEHQATIESLDGVVEPERMDGACGTRVVAGHSKS